MSAGMPCAGSAWSSTTVVISAIWPASGSATASRYLPALFMLFQRPSPSGSTWPFSVKRTFCASGTALGSSAVTAAK